MINTNINASSVNKVNAKVELYNGSTLVTTCTCNDRLQDFTVERVGQNNKFFGFGVFHKVTINFIDLERTLTISEANSFKLYFGSEDTFVNPYPTFYTNKVTRDETTNTITVVAYCKLATEASTHTVSEVEAPYTIREFASAAVDLLGVAAVEFQGIDATETCLDTYYENGGNFEGTESYQEALTQIAEVTQTIYFLNNEDKLIFKRLDRDGLPVLTITKNDYYNLESEDIRRLSTIVDTNELGNSTSIETRSVTGVTQYVRNNPFWELRDDIQLLLTHAGAVIGGISASPFHCVWDGNFLLEVGDKIALVAEDNSTITSYVLNDIIRYDSTLEETTQFIHNGNEETASNPVNLGERLKQTYAKVDKQNKQIELVASETAANSSSIASLNLAVDGINLAIESLENATLGDFTDLTKRVVALELSDTEIKASVTETQTSVENVEENVTELGKEISDAVVAVGVLNGTVTNHTANINALLGTVENHTQDLGTLNGTVTTHTEKIGTLTTTTNEISARVGTVETKTQELESDLGDVSAKVTTNTTEIGSLKLSADEFSTEIGTLKTKTEELTSKDTAIDGSITELTGKITTNTEDIASLKLTTDEFSVSIGNLETKTQELTQKDTDIEGNITELSGKVTTNTTDIGTLKLTTDELSVSVGNLNTKTEELTQKDTTIEGNISELSSKVTTNTTDIAALKVSTDEISASITSLETKTEELTTKDTELAGDITEVNNKVTTNSEEIAALKITTDEISASVSSVTSRTETLETKTGTLETNVDTLGTDLDTLETNVGTLESNLGEVSDQVDANTGDISSLASRVTTTETSIGELTVTTEEISASVSSITTTTEELGTSLDTLETQVETNTTNIGELQIKDDEITASVSELETRASTLEDADESLRENIASLQITADSISASVSSLETNTTDRFESVNDSYEALAKEVNTKVTAEDITIAIEEERSRGAEKVTTTTGFTFNNDGLTITKSDSEISTNIDEDGLSVYKYDEEVLTADNTGVQAKNLHATTYLIIGTNTYFADYTAEDGESRAGCFWTGKQEVF